MKYIFLFFPPGAGGNFFSRCLNLLDNSYCWVDATTQVPIQDQQEKLKLLSYQSVSSLDPQQRIWTQFEGQLRHYQNKQLPDTAQVVIWPGHPDYKLLEKDLVGQDDQEYCFLIDASDNFEWCLLNSLYKNSFISVQWLETAEQMRQDSNIQKISLHSMVNSFEGFMKEFQTVCDTIGHALTRSEKEAIEILYHEWKTTILDYSQFANFKQRIGFHW